MKPQYEADFYSWAKHNAQLLRSGQLAQADLENIAEELDGLSRSEKRALQSHLKNLLLHLLKWKYQHDLSGKSWRLSIRNSRRSVLEVLKESPGLKRAFKGTFNAAYKDAREDAADETGLELDTFPKTCPFSQDQVMDEGFLPEERKSA